VVYLVPNIIGGIGIWYMLSLVGNGVMQINAIIYHRVIITFGLYNCTD